MTNFWNEYFWLPENVSWNDLKSNSTVHYPQVSDLQYTIIFGIVLLFVRILVECFVFLPIGKMFGWVETREGLFNRVLKHLNFGFAGKSKFKRVAETAWRLLFYICAWTAGVFILWNEPQLRDITECWRNWPHHPISSRIWWYYIIETSFYWALLFSSIVFDIRRADFLQMTFHHIVTIFLLFMSFSMNMIRAGTLILFSHDVSDIFIELGKLFRYAGWDMALQIDFIVFMLLWIITRLIYYPFWIMRSVLFDAPFLLQKNYHWTNLLQRPIVPRVLVVMLLCLLILHIFWTYVILKVAVASIRGEDLSDIRESDEMVEDNGVDKIKKDD